MYSIHAPYSVERIDSSDKGRKYLLIVYDRPYSIGELVYLIIRYIGEGKSLEEICGRLNEWTGGTYLFTKEKVTAIIEHSIRPLGIFDKTSQHKGPSRLATIQGQWTVAKFENIRWLLEVLKFGFQPAVFTVVLLGAIGVNYHYMQTLISQASLSPEIAYRAGGECLKSFSYIALFYPLILLILFFHELGHAAAAYLFGVRPKNIGCGFYLIFPVLYADITEAWKLNKWQKTIVNLGGVYFQLLINLALLYWLYHSPDQDTREIIGYVIGLNMATVIINSNPFFKFDGYWVYSDLFSLPNLKEQSNAYALTVLKAVFPRIPFRVSPNSKKIVNTRNPFLILYTVCKYLFMGYIVSLLGTMLVNQVRSIGMVFGLLASRDFSVCAFEFYLKTTLSSAAIVYFSLHYKKMYEPFVRQTIRKKTLA